MRLAYLGSILAIIILLSAAGTSYAAGPGVKVFAKEKDGQILIVVRNGSGPSIQGIQLKVHDGEIRSVQAPAGWTVETYKSDPTSASLSTTSSPIKANGRVVILIDASNVNAILSWSVQGKAGFTIEASYSKTVVRQAVEYRPSPAAESPNSFPDLRSMTVATDKVVYNPNDKMIISGKMKPKSDITITIYTPSGDKIKITDDTDIRGEFKILHILHDAASGTYNLKIRQADTSIETVFKVL